MLSADGLAAMKRIAQEKAGLPEGNVAAKKLVRYYAKRRKTDPFKYRLKLHYRFYPRSTTVDMFFMPNIVV